MTKEKSSLPVPPTQLEQEEIEKEEEKKQEENKVIESLGGDAIDSVAKKISEIIFSSFDKRSVRIGEVVHYYPPRGSNSYNQGKPIPAIIVEMFENPTVNLIAFNANGDIAKNVPFHVPFYFNLDQVDENNLGNGCCVRIDILSSLYQFQK